MVETVVRHLMPGIMDRLDKLGKLFHPSTVKKESGFHPALEDLASLAAPLRPKLH